MSQVPPLNWQKSPDGLLPAIIQDAETGRVLMLGYMNQEALETTMKTKLVTFYSRSKKRLWRKGEKSGNVLTLVSVTPDCDNDALLILATPTGPTCHTGTRSCFGDDAASPLTIIGDLATTIKERSENVSTKGVMVSSSNHDTLSDSTQLSYTKSLLAGGPALCGAKVLEEAGEFVRAALREGRERTIEEAADLLYHMLVLLRSNDIETKDVIDELRKRS